MDGFQNLLLHVVPAETGNYRSQVSLALLRQCVRKSLAAKSFCLHGAAWFCRFRAASLELATPEGARKSFSIATCVLADAAVSENDRPFSVPETVFSDAGDGFENRAGM